MIYQHVTTIKKLNKFERTEITQSMFFNHNEIKLIKEENLGNSHIWEFQQHISK